MPIANLCLGNPYTIDEGLMQKGYTLPSEAVAVSYADALAQCQTQGMQLIMPKTEVEYLMMLDMALDLRK